MSFHKFFLVSVSAIAFSVDFFCLASLQGAESPYPVSYGSIFEIKAADLGLTSLTAAPKVSAVCMVNGKSTSKTLSLVSTTYPATTVECQVSTALPKGEWPIYVTPKGGAVVLLARQLSVRSPDVVFAAPSHATAGVAVTLSGYFFGTTKPVIEVVYTDAKGEKKAKACSVASSKEYMNPYSGSSLTVFTFPTGIPDGECVVYVTSKVGGGGIAFNTNNYAEVEVGLYPGPGGITAPFGTQKILVGEIIRIYAEPAAGYFFAGWTCDAGAIVDDTALQDTDAEILGNAKITATFSTTAPAMAAMTLAVIPEAAGSTTPTPSATVIVGVPRRIQAIPEVGYEFVKWTNDDGKAVFADFRSAATWGTLTGDAAITANFVELEGFWKLVMHASAAGIGTTDPAIGPHKVPVGGDPVGITAYPAAGYYFTSWTVVGDATLSTTIHPSAKLVVRGDTTVTATFAPGAAAYLTMAMFPSDASWVQIPATGEHLFKVGEAVSITVTEIAAATAPAFLYWTGVGGVTLSDTLAKSTTATMSGDATVTAVFDHKSLNAPISFRQSYQYWMSDGLPSHQNTFTVSIKMKGDFSQFNENTRIALSLGRLNVFTTLGKIDLAGKGTAVSFTTVKEAIAAASTGCVTSNIDSVKGKGKITAFLYKDRYVKVDSARVEKTVVIEKTEMNWDSKQLKIALTYSDSYADGGKSAELPALGYSTTETGVLGLLPCDLKDIDQFQKELSLPVEPLSLTFGDITYVATSQTITGKAKFSRDGKLASASGSN